MKKLLLTIMLSLIGFFSFAQSPVRPGLPIINLSSELATYGVYFFPNYTYEFKQHTFGAGPTINIYPSYKFVHKSDNVYYPNDSKFYGCRLYYQYNFRPGKVIDLFLQTNLNFEHMELLDYQEPMSNAKIPYKSKTVNFGQSIGVGVKLNFSERIYANVSLDYGINYSKKISETAGYAGQTDKPSDGAGIIRVGFGYRL